MRKILVLLAIVLCIALMVLAISASSYIATTPPAPVPAATFFDEDIPASTRLLSLAQFKLPSFDVGTVVGDYFYTEDSVCEIYLPDEEITFVYSHVINTAHDLLDANVYMCMVPTAYEQINIFTSSMGEEQKNEPYQRDVGIFVNALVDDEVVKVDVFDDLSSGYDLGYYLRTERYLNSSGMYQVYKKFIEATGEIAVDISAYEENSVSFHGALYDMEPVEGMRVNPDEFVYYTPFTRYSASSFLYDGGDAGGRWYTMDLLNVPDENSADYALEMNINYDEFFMDKDLAIGLIETDIESDRSIVVVSEGALDDAFSMLLMPHYKRIFMVDPVLYEYSLRELVEENGIDDVLFLNYTPSLNNQEHINALVQRVGAQ